MSRGTNRNDGSGLYGSRRSSSSINNSHHSYGHHRNHHTGTDYGHNWSNERNVHRNGVYNSDPYANTLSYGSYYRSSIYDNNGHASSGANQARNPNVANGSLDMQVLEELDAAIAYEPTKIIIHCNKCGSGFSSRGNLNRHDRTKHRKERVYCRFRYCTKSFSQKSDLKRHLSRVHEK